MSLVSILKGRSGPSGFGFASTAEEVTEGLDLRGKRILITGCNSGLGLESARVLALRGATILGCARTMEKAEAALASIPGDGHVPLACELSDPTSVRACVEQVSTHDEEVDVILCNAGIMALPKRETAHGYELQFFTNHVGHFLLVTGLLDELAPTGRVVMLSSEGHRMAPSAGIDFDNLDSAKSYSSWTAYGRSKLANVLFANALATRLKPGQTANSLHPGVIQTNLGRHMGLSQIIFPLVGWIFTKSIPQGAATQVWAATSPDLAETTGAYFSDANVAKASRHGRDAALAERLWTKSEEIRDALA